MKKSGYKPGQVSPVSGQGVVVGPRGGIGKEVTVVKGHVIPPLGPSGSTLKIVDTTKNKSGKP